MADNQQKFLTTLVTDQPTRQNFDVANKNFKNVFEQLSANNTSVGSVCTSFSTNAIYPTLVNATNLQASITTGGKKPVAIFLNQKSDSLSIGVYSIGNIKLENVGSSFAQAIFYIVRDQTPIWGTILGSGFSGFSASGPQDWYEYISPSAIFALDVSPPPGVHTYFLKAAAYGIYVGTPVTLTFTQLELVAKELF